MANILFNISSALLLIIIAWHVFASMVWGNWDQEGTGSLGFWRIFIESGANLAWIYGVLIVVIIVAWGFKDQADNGNE